MHIDGLGCRNVRVDTIGHLYRNRSTRSIRAGMIQELVLVRDGLLCLSADYFAPAGVDALTAQLCV